MKLKSKYIRLKDSERLYSLKKPLIALTGGIATGKSTVTKLLEARGIKIIDADQLVKLIYKTPEAQSLIQNKYSNAWTPEGIDFKKLREIFFQDENAKKEIESFIYKNLPQAFLTEASKYPDQKFYFYDVPLLFERGMESVVDLSIVVYSPRSLQKERLMDRDGHVEALANKILSHQIDIEDKKLKADFVIDNSLDKEKLAARLDEVLQQIFDDII